MFFESVQSKERKLENVLWLHIYMLCYHVSPLCVCMYVCACVRAFACICLTTVITKSQDCFYQKFLSISPDIHSSHQNLMIIALKTHDCIITTTTTQINPTKKQLPPPHPPHPTWLSDQNLLTKNSLETHVYLYKQISWSSPPKPLSVLLNSHDCIIRKMYACLTKKCMTVSPRTYACLTKNSWLSHQKNPFLFHQEPMTVSPRTHDNVTKISWLFHHDYHDETFNTFCPKTSWLFHQTHC